MKKLLVTLLFISCLPSLVYAYQFEDYEWGMHREKVIEKMANKSKYIFRSTNKARPSEISYDDNIFGRDCSITLNFTESSHLLMSVSIYWGIGPNFDNLKKMLIAKYGEPNESDSDSASWSNPEEDNELRIYSDNVTQIFYTNGKYKRLNEKEMAEAITKEKDRF